MTKEEKIKEAYGETYEGLRNYIDVNGWVNQNKTKRSYFNSLEFNDKQNSMRPLELKGIESNNGWIKIESESDLPKEELDCHFIFKQNDKKYQTFGVWDNKLKSFWSGALRINYVTHYQPIQKPESPIY